MSLLNGGPQGPSLNDIISILVDSNETGDGRFTFRYESGQVYCDVWDDSPKVTTVIEVGIGLHLPDQSKFDFDVINSHYLQ